ncbi:MAG: ImmA/IrrE family metallo-endopeptidase [Prevotella intermedia]
MYIISKKESLGKDDSLRNILKEFITQNEIPIYALAQQLNIDRRAFEKYIEEGCDLKFRQALAIMDFLNITEADFIKAYRSDITNVNSTISTESSKALSYILKKFDIPTLKELGVIKKRAKITDYEAELCSFLGFKDSIYEYDTFSMLPTLFSKSKYRIAEEKSSKMTDFWLRCAIYSFESIGNPYEYDKELLIEFIKRIHTYTEDRVNGYEKATLVLYRLGVTVLTQPYISKTGSFGVTMILNGKPCIVITDMNKKYYKLWLSLLHELYHVINDYDMLESTKYHISSEENPELLFNEQKADSFARDVLIPFSLQPKLEMITKFPLKVKTLARELNIDPTIIYGVYLELLPKNMQKSEFAKFGSKSYLIPSDCAVKEILFNPIARKSLNSAIENIKENLYKKQII